MPPKALVMVMERRSIWVPTAPQLTEQADQPTHSPISQSIGQGSKLHGWVSELAGHARPSATIGCSTVRLRNWMPPPQETSTPSLLQGLQELHELTSQSVSHGSMLHVRFALKIIKSHEAPVPTSGCAISRARVEEPPPHDLVHVDQVDQAVAWQSTGQTSVLQTVVRNASPQALPPKAAAILGLRVSILMPLPQVAEQENASTQSPSSQLIGQWCW